MTFTPAAMKTLIAHFEDTGRNAGDYDLIATGDLGKLGSDILRDLCGEKGINLGANYHDCGAMIYQFSDGVCQGGSGCGCGAAVLNTYIMDKMEAGEWKKVLFIATGALMSPTTAYQGESIPSIAHGVVLESE
ncbi:MAG: hypothetical protein LBL66_05330 [Clostridiales bacterium]|nr:hypothetical protein [Clostridiales bacterium]